MGRIAELRKRVRGISLGTIWVCQCCALSHANGECCADDSHGGDGIEPWALWDDPRYNIAAGMAWEEHADGCVMHDRDRVTASEDCECEHITFGTWSCGGCGSGLAGDRFAHTPFRYPQFFRSNIGTIDFHIAIRAALAASVARARAASDAHRS